MNAVLEAYADGAPIPSDELEYAARQRMDEVERGGLNRALLKRLGEAKEAYGTVERRKDYLHDPEISTLVNTLTILNEPFLRARAVRHAKGHPEERIDDLMSTGLAGPCSIDADVSGLMGAILHFTYQDERGGWNAAEFTALMRQCIDNSFRPSAHDLQRMRHAKPLDAYMAGGEAKGWVDRHAQNPRTVVMSAELQERLDRAVEKLPPDQRDAANYIFSFIREHNRRPSSQELGETRPEAMTREGGRLLCERAINRLKTILQQDCPDLAEQGEIGGYAEFCKVFPKTRRVLGAAG